MKKLLRFIGLPVLALTSINLSSCNLHAHNYEYKYDENNHWQECTTCKKKIGVTSHSMDALTDKCFVCNYHDPIVKTNGSATSIGLTNYGKTKQTITFDNSILLIGNGTFANSECKTLYISKDLIAIQDGALEGGKLEKEGIIDPEAEHVEWKYENGYYLRKDKIDENEVFVKDGSQSKYYKTLKDAMEADGKNDITITLLRKEITLNGDIDLKKAVTLEPLYPEGCSIIENNHKVFIHPSGSLRIGPTVKYNAPTDLIRTITVERKGDTQDNDVWVFGSLVFFDTHEISQTINVNYVDADKTTQLGKATASIQTTGATSASEQENVCYGVFKMRKVGDTYQIKGLSKFGESITKLKITNPIEGKEFIIDNLAFVIKGKIEVPLPIIKDPTIWLLKQKGAYQELEIGEGIVGINNEAFSTAVDGHITREILIQLTHLLCPLRSLKISNGVKYIGAKAFFQCMSLENVYFEQTVTENMPDVTIYDWAFANCFLLENVDFTNCPNLKVIFHETFSNCDMLHGLTLGNRLGWLITEGTPEKYKVIYSYLPEDMTPEYVSTIIKTSCMKYNWIRTTNAETECKFAYCYDRDKSGKFNKVSYFKTFEDAFKKFKDTKNNDGCTIRIFKNAGNVNANLTDCTINKDLHIIADPGIEVHINTPNPYFVVNEDKWLIVSNNVNFDRQINLRCKVKIESGTSTYTNVAGFAKVSGGEFQQVGYSNDGTGFIEAQPTTAVIDGEKHSSFGLFNFNVRRIKDDRYQTLLSLTSLGAWATEFSARCPALGKAGCVNDCKVGANAFNGGEKINKVDLHDEVKEVENSAFTNCQFLTEVTVSTGLKTIGEKGFFNCQRLSKVLIDKKNNVLKKISKEAFLNCTSLTYFDFGSISSGWKAGGVPLTEDLSTPSIAAKTIIGEHSNVDWTRE